MNRGRSVPSRRTGAEVRDLTDEEARAALPLKWGTVERGVLPAWVAEMDYAPPPPIIDALQRALSAGRLSYPVPGAGGELGEAYAAFAARHYGQALVPEQVLPVVDVTVGLRLTLEVLSDPDPVVLPVPAYPPLLALPEVTGRRRVDLLLDPDAERAELDLERLEALLAAGARTILLTQPHNPWGRAFSRTELEGVRDLALRHRARVISDEIHGPLVLPGARHVSYLDIEGTADHAVAVVAPSKGFNVAGLRCAQLVVPDPDARRRLQSAPLVHNDSWSSLGVAGAVAAYTACDDWLAALVARLDSQRFLLTQLLSDHLPDARSRVLEATYLAWLDLRPYGHNDPAVVALRRSKVRLSAGHDFQPGLTGHLRLNIATSPERLREIVLRLAAATTAGSER